MIKNNGSTLEIQSLHPLCMAINFDGQLDRLRITEEMRKHTSDCLQDFSRKD